MEIDLRNAGLSESDAAAVAAGLGEAMAAVDAISDAVDEILPDTDPFFNPTPPEAYPTEFNHDGLPIEWSQLTIASPINTEGDLLGGDVDNAFEYAQGNGSITIYDYSGDTASADRLVFLDISADQVTFSQNDDFDLVITLENGDTVTINNYFYSPNGEAYEVIEAIAFANFDGSPGGDVLTPADISAIVGEVVIVSPTTLTGTGGDDVIDEADAALDQVIEAGAGNDDIYDGHGNDTVYGGEGNDNFYAGAGADHYDGGTGKKDVVDYSNSTTGLTINLADSSSSTGIAQGDSYANIDRLYGTDFDDIIIGDGSISLIKGGGGDDHITDGAGKSLLRGGDGADTFHFVSDGEIDRIYDFYHLEDVLDISASGASGVSELTFTETNSRLTISFGSETIVLDGYSIEEVADFTSDVFIF